MNCTLTVRGDTGFLLGDVWQLLLLGSVLQNLADVLLDAHLALMEHLLEQTHTGWVHPGTFQSLMLSCAPSPPGQLQECSWTYCIRLILHS